MAKKELTEAFNLLNGKMKAKNGNTYNIVYVDTKSSESTYPHQSIFKKYGARWMASLKTWGWFLGNDPQTVYHKQIEPCLDELTRLEDEGNGIRKDEVENIINSMIDEYQNGEVAEIAGLDSQNIADALIEFKNDLMQCASSEEFMKRMMPIIKFQQAHGHAFSLGNCIAILIQDPDATLVKSKTNWLAVNRRVLPNAKVIQLSRPNKKNMSPKEKAIVKQNYLASCGVKSVKELTPGQKEELNVQLSNGEFVDVTQNEKLKLFVKYCAYDVRFTETIPGKEDLVGHNDDNIEWYDKSKEEFEQVAILMDATKQVISDSGVNIEYVEASSLNGALGVSCSGTIKIPNTNENTQNAIVTLWHEFAHELLHQKFLHSKLNTNPEFAAFYLGKHGRGIIEQQAELVGWIVSKYFGFDREYSLNYVAGWGGLKDKKQTAHLFDQVASVSSFIISKVMAKLGKAETAFNDGDNNNEVN